MSKKQEIKLTETDKKYSAFNKELSAINDRINEIDDFAQYAKNVALEASLDVFMHQKERRYLNKKVNIIASFVVITAIALIVFVVR